MLGLANEKALAQDALGEINHLAPVHLGIDPAYLAAGGAFRCAEMSCQSQSGRSSFSRPLWC